MEGIEKKCQPKRSCDAGEQDFWSSPYTKPRPDLNPTCYFKVLNSLKANWGSLTETKIKLAGAKLWQLLELLLIIADMQVPSCNKHKQMHSHTARQISSYSKQQHYISQFETVETLVYHSSASSHVLWPTSPPSPSQFSLHSVTPLAFHWPHQFRNGAQELTWPRSTNCKLPLSLWRNCSVFQMKHE